MDFINVAYAADAAAAQQAGGGWSAIVMLLVFVALIYVLIWRPQSKRNKEQRSLISSIKVGDEVVTIGGIYGKVVSVADSYFEIELASNMVVKCQRAAVSMLLPKGAIKAS